MLCAQIMQSMTPASKVFRTRDFGAWVLFRTVFRTFGGCIKHKQPEKSVNGYLFSLLTVRQIRFFYSFWAIAKRTFSGSAKYFIIKHLHIVSRWDMPPPAGGNGDIFSPCPVFLSFLRVFLSFLLDIDSVIR